MSIHTRPRAGHPLAVAALALILAVPTLADEWYSDKGFFIDLPEGFDLAGGDGESSFTFLSLDQSVVAEIQVAPGARYPTARSAWDSVAKKLATAGSPYAYRYANRDALLAEVSFGSGTSSFKGLLFVLDGPSADAEAYDLTLLVYSLAGDYGATKDVIASALDGFSADAAHRAAPGPLGTRARAQLGKARSTRVNLSFGRASLVLDWDPREGAVAQDTTEREYRVLAPYGAVPELVDAAVKRFYRMVWRDCAPSLDRLALELAHAWSSGAWAGPGGQAPRKADSLSPSHGTAADPRAYAAALLNWTQNWTYQRNPQGSDVVNPLSAAMEGRGDCDSRALVLAALLRREGIETLLLVSLEHQHALAAVKVPGGGARYPYRDQNWVIAETTAKVDIGLIDSSMSDIEDWLPVEFPF